MAKENTADMVDSAAMTTVAASSGHLLVKPGSIEMMTMTVEDYEQNYWSKLSAAVIQLLLTLPGQYLPLSYEQMYSCVYKCVCKQFGERLYSDLVQLVTDHLEQLSLQLQMKSAESVSVYLMKFNFITDRYLQALHSIVPVFNYLNKFYVEARSKSELGAELKHLFVDKITDKHINTLLSVLDEAHRKPFCVEPAVMSTLIKNLYVLKPDYARLRMHIFARYIPNVLPPCTLTDLEHYIHETRQIQRDLLSHPDFIRGDQSRKRFCDDADVLYSGQSQSQSHNPTSGTLSTFNVSPS
jgi:hypothetical protein